MRRPWNIVNSPIYSLATYKDERFNMNVCSWVMCVSRKPRRYVIALEQGSLSYEWMKQTKLAVLQILTKAQIDLVRPLGQKSGKQMNKEAYLQKKGLLSTWQGFSVLEGSAAYLLLDKLGRRNVGDHDLYTFELLKYKTIQEDGLLGVQDLIDGGLML